MQARSATWEAIAENGDFAVETVAEIHGVEYESISAPVIKRALGDTIFPLGVCSAASLDVSILGAGAIPTSEAVRIKARLVGASGIRSEYLPQGTFYISKRSTDAVTGLITLECFDAMLKANDNYRCEESDFPKTAAEVVGEIAAIIGVTVDDRTTLKTGDAYTIPYPGAVSMSDILGWIGAVNGGNWIITPEGKLRLVPLFDASDDTIDITGVTGSLESDIPISISKVIMETAGTAFEAGDDNGYSLLVSENPLASQAICNDLYNTLHGKPYYPYAATGAIYDPAAELGDLIDRLGELQSILVNEEVALAYAFRASISAPGSAEVADEYPYLSRIEKAVQKAQEAADSAITDSIREYTVTNSTAPPGEDAEWSSATPAKDEGQYIWERTVNTYGSGRTETSEPVLLTGNAGEAGEDAVLLRVDSSHGLVFKNNTVSTVLSVTIYKGSQIITDAAAMHRVFGAGAYIQWSWLRLGEDRYGVISAEDSRIFDGGFKFRLTPDDVDTKVTFQCSLMVT